MSSTPKRADRYVGLRQIDTRNLLVDETLKLLRPEDDDPLDLDIPRPANPDELERFIADALGLRVPHAAVRKGHAAPWDAFCCAYFANDPICIWLGARGLAGKTFTLALLGWVESVTLHASVNILGGSSNQSEKVLEYLKSFWEHPNAPRRALLTDPTQRRVKLRWGNMVSALTASQKQARGYHPQRLRLDEADEMDYALFNAVRGQPMEKAGVAAQTVISSTHHYPNGTMTKALKEAAERNWPIFRWGYDETLETNGGWLTQEQLNRSRATMSVETWRVEVELGEPSTEGRAIMTTKVEAMFMEPAIVCDEGQEYEFEPPILNAPQGKEPSYVHGVDWGQSSDYTEQVVWRTDVTPMRLVAYCYMRRRPYPEMVGRLDARMLRYPGDGAHDYTGVGRVGEFLHNGSVEDVTMVGNVRRDLFRDYILTIERDAIRAPRITRLYEMHKYVRNVDLYTGYQAEDGIAKGHPPDGFVAMAMANKASALAPVRILFARSGAQKQLEHTKTAIADFMGRK